MLSREGLATHEFEESNQDSIVLVLKLLERFVSKITPGSSACLGPVSAWVQCLPCISGNCLTIHRMEESRHKNIFSLHRASWYLSARDYFSEMPLEME